MKDEKNLKNKEVKEEVKAKKEVSEKDLEKIAGGRRPGAKTALR